MNDWYPSSELNGSPVGAILPIRSDPSRIYLLDALGFGSSSDAGVTWSGAFGPCPNDAVTAAYAPSEWRWGVDFTTENQQLTPTASCSIGQKESRRMGHSSDPCDRFKRMFDFQTSIDDDSGMKSARLRLLDAAEQEFAAHGFHGASLRAITRRAGVNVAAAHYYYGSKETLLRATLERIVKPVNEKRLALLDEALAADGSPSVETILDAFLRPDLEMIAELGERGAIIARFSGRSYTEPDEVVSRMLTELFADLGDRFVSALQLSLPDLPREEVWWRLRCVVAIITYLLTTTGTPRSMFDRSDIGGASRRLICFLAPGMRSGVVDIAPPAAEAIL